MDYEKRNNIYMLDSIFVDVLSRQFVSGFILEHSTNIGECAT